MVDTEKIKSFVKNNYHIILLVLMFFSMGYGVWHANYYSDDYNYIRIAAADWKSVFEFMKWHINNFNGRTIIHFTEILFLRFKYGYILWRIAVTLVMCGVCSCVSKICSTDKEDYKLGCVFSILMVTATVPIFWKWSVGWLSSSFNYIFPSAAVLLLMLIISKKPESFWIFPLSFVCGATAEQMGIMTVGLFVLLIGEFFIRNKKLQTKYIFCLALSILGYLTVLLSPGTFKRSDAQGKLSGKDMIVNLITVLRRRWLDNLYLAVLVTCIAAFTIYWLIKFRNRNAFTKKFNTAAAIALSTLTVLNLGLKMLLLLMKFLGRTVEFSKPLNYSIFAIYMVYLILYFGLFGFSTILIYQEHKNVYPFIGFVLGLGSQVMLAVSESSLHRMSVPGFFMFMIYTAYSASPFIKDISQLKKIRIKFNLVPLIAIVCAVACVFQGFVFSKTVLEGTKPEDFVNVPITSETLQTFTDELEASFYYCYTGDLWHENYDITDFTLLR